MIKYFALISPSWGDLATAKIIGFFREVDEPNAHSLESFRKDGQWASNEYYLAPFIYQGEPGAEEVSAEDAERIKAMLLDQWKSDESK